VLPPTNQLTSLESPTCFDQFEQGKPAGTAIPGKEKSGVTT